MAAGLGFKTFTTGEVLTAADTNGYLMQGVLVFASSAARAAAITSPQEGQYSYLKDTNSTEYYDGAAWIAAPIGDITGVTAGVGITGGGTSGTVTVTNDMATTITASGDIVVGTGSGTYDNLPIGTTGQILTADTTVSPYKVKWATAGGSGANWSLLNSGGTALSGSSTVTVSGISGKDKIMVIVSGASTVTAGYTATSLRLNTDSSGNYGTFGLSFLDGGASSANNQTSNTEIPIGRSTTDAASIVAGYVLLSGCNASGTKIFNSAGGVSPGSGAYPRSYILGGWYTSSSTISSISIISEAGNFDAGTVYVYTSA